MTNSYTKTRFKKIGKQEQMTLCTVWTKVIKIVNLTQKLTTVLKNGCFKHSLTVILFSGSTTKHLRIRSLGSSKSNSENVRTIDI